VRRRGRLARFLASLALFGLGFSLGAQAAIAVNPELTLRPAKGAAGSTLAATYEDMVPAAALCTAGTVDFWWDAAGPGSGNAGAKKLGSATIAVQDCVAVAPALKVPKASCGRHVVYAFRSRNGDPVPTSVTSAAFTVNGCATASPAPTARPTPAPTPSAPPLPTATPGAEPSTAPSALPSGSPAASNPAAPTPASVGPLVTPPPVPPPPPPPSSVDLAGILVLVILGLLPIGVWAAAVHVKLGIVSGGASKWAGLVLAVILGGGLTWAGSLKFGLKPVPVSAEFEYTGGSQFWVVPEGVEVAHVWVMGAAGGAGCPLEPLDFQGHPHNAGGSGHEITSSMPVTPGQVIQVNVGGKGHDGECDGSFGEASNALGGFNGGGAGGAGGKGIPSLVSYNGGGGGGASDVRHAPYGLAARDVVAGGGGGGGGAASSDDSMKGGPGGCPTGEAGPGANGQGGGGGILTMGGIGGANGGNGGLSGEWGTFGLGGAGADRGSGQTAGGGGGGGWNGGGGGGSGAGSQWGGGGGGGGCRWPEGGDYDDTNAVSFGNGRVVIQYTQYVSIFWGL
jgi:hypothetical protein